MKAKTPQPCLLTYEKIAQTLFHNTTKGYYTIGLIAITTRYLTGLLTILIYGTWLHETFLISINTFVLMTVTLFALPYLKTNYHKTIDTIITDPEENKEFKHTNPLINKKLWYILFTALFLNQIIWYFYELNTIITNPTIVATLPYRGANQGIIPLTYEAFHGIFLYILFVDLIAILFTITFLPNKLKKHLCLDELHPDRCGGLSIIGRLMLITTATYFSIIAIGSLGRFYNKYYYYFIVATSIIFGLIIFFLPQYSTHRLIVEQKEKKLNETTDNLKQSLQTKHKTKEEEYRESIKRLELFRFREEIQGINEYPFNTRILFTFLGFTLFPIIANIISYFLQEII